MPYADIPQGYTRCKYLEFTGTQYFNSGIKSSNTIGVKIDFSFNYSNYLLFGCRKDASHDSFTIGYFTSNGRRCYVGYGGTTSDILLSNSSINDGAIHNIQLDSVNAKVDEENFMGTLNRGTFTSYYDIYIGTWNNDGTADNRMFVGKIYAMKIYDTTQTLGNFIPCLDDNDVPCLYDTVSGNTFYNQGTGTFGYEIEPQPTEIWSCGEYSAVDGKYHILVQPQGGSIADIALTEPLRKVNDVADSIEFPSDTEGKALVTRKLKQIIMSSIQWYAANTANQGSYRYLGEVNDAYPYASDKVVLTMNTASYKNMRGNDTYNSNEKIIGMYSATFPPRFSIYDPNYDKKGDLTAFLAYLADKLLIYQLATLTTELVDAPQIAEAESYTCEISQGGKAVEWTEFETE